MRTHFITGLVGVTATVAGLMISGPSVHAQSAPQPQQTVIPGNVAVQPGDSLEKIAAPRNVTYQRLFDANTQLQDPDMIYPGQIIRVPAQDEQLASRPMPVAQPAAVEQPAAAQPAAAPAVSAYRAAAQPAVRASAPAATAVAGSSTWDRLAQCESGGNWATNTGNGFSGGLQFTPGTWRAHGGTGNPANASREQQIAVAESVKASQGWGAWPACSSKLGLR